MTLRHIKIFVMVCECGSVTVASEKLYIAQPSVSLAISELESHYSVKLFDRISRRLHITEVGKRFFDYAVHIISLYNEMEDSIKSWDITGTLRIGASITIGTRLMPELVNRFAKSCPSVKVNVAIDNSESIERLILNGEIDLGLIEGIAHKPKIVMEKFLDDELVLICGKSHILYPCEEVALEALSKYDFILREKGSATRELFDSSMMMHSIAIKPIWESISTRAIIQAVAEGIGLSVLPYRLAEQDVDAGLIRWVPIKDLSFTREFYIIYHSNKFFSKSAKMFMDEVKKIELCIPKIR